MSIHPHRFIVREEQYEILTGRIFVQIIRRAALPDRDREGIRRVRLELESLVADVHAIDDRTVGLERGEIKEGEPKARILAVLLLLE